MYYTRDGGPITPHRERTTLRGGIDRGVLPDIPEESWRDTNAILPFAEDTSVPTIIAACLRFCDGLPRTNAVYVLECRHNSRYRGTAARYFGRVDQRWTTQVDGAERLLYVGLTSNLVRRLDEHLNHPGTHGAQFTTVFPPLRILDVSWYSSYEEAKRAEKLTAKRLQDHFPDDYVYQA